MLHSEIPVSVECTFFNHNVLLHCGDELVFLKNFHGSADAFPGAADHFSQITIGGAVFDNQATGRSFSIMLAQSDKTTDDAPIDIEHRH